MQHCRCCFFKYIGSPVQFRGLGNEISSSFVLTRTVGDRPMKIHCLPGYISALYLVEYPEEGRMLLLDSGFPSDLERVRFYIEEVMAAGKGAARQSMAERLQLVVATHSHVDHMGASLGYERCGIPVAVAKGVDKSYVGLGGRIAQLSEILFSYIMASRMGRKVCESPFVFSKSVWGPYWQAPAKPLRLENAAPLPLGFSDWVAVKCPGHTSHMVCLYHPHSQIFYMADMFVGLKKGFYPPLLIGDAQAYRRTLHRLRGLPTRCALLAHGGIVDVRDRCGSWGALIDEVAEQHASSAMSGASLRAAQSFETVKNLFFNDEDASLDVLSCEHFLVEQERSELPELHILDS